MRVPLIASRFLETREGVLDLATGDLVTLRRLPPCERADEGAWRDACERLLHLWHEDLPALIDYGHFGDGRFEAYQRMPRRPLSQQVHAAVSAFLGAREGVNTDISDGEPRFGMNLAIPRALLAVAHVLEDARPGEALSIECVAEPAAGATTFLRLAAVAGRRRGFVPVRAAVLEDRPQLRRRLEGRSVLLLSDRPESARAAQKWFFRLGVGAASTHVLLRATDRPSRHVDLSLRLDPIEPATLVRSVHGYPAVSPGRLRAAARESGGLPGRFLAHLRNRAVHAVEYLRVAEAHPAYDAGESPGEPELGHPWKELIASAVRLAVQGRTAAADRDLKQISAAADRRHVELAAASADVALARMRLARGRIAEAEALLRLRVERNGGSVQLGAKAALMLGYVHLLQAEFERAESTFRVSRTAAPAQAAVGLAWTLLAQGRDAEAERALAPARESTNADARASAAAMVSAAALFRHDLPAAARAAADARHGRDAAVPSVIASMLLAIVHGRIGDRPGAEQHARSAFAGARTARDPLVAITARGALIEARCALGMSPPRTESDRMLRLANRLPALLRGWLWAVYSRAHPVEQRRAEVTERLDSFVRHTGARAFRALASDPSALRASDTATLMSIYESGATPIEMLTRIAGWLRERLHARSVAVSDAAGAVLARSGAHDVIAAIPRVLQTRLPQPPWAMPDAVESGVVVRYANAVQGVIACRWPLSRTVTEDVVSILTAAASVVGPTIMLLVERSRATPPAADGIVGKSVAVARLRAQISRAAAAPFPVLVEGESGAGKELVARAIHRESARRLRACVAINCAAISEDLFEAEVFGHARGAFTGAHVERAGLFEQADGGTLFLDEVSELSARAQAKLLRVLQEGEVRRLGEGHARRVDVRVVVASNKRLDEEVTAGRFRSDLLFRLAVIRIAVPPLRARREDIPLLASCYWGTVSERAGTRAVLTSAAVARLAEYDWPGNVRELQNVIAALAVQVPRGPVEPDHVSALLRIPAREEHGAGDSERRLDAARRAFEKQFIATTLARCGGRHGAAARQLGITRQGLAKLMKRLEL